MSWILCAESDIPVFVSHVFPVHMGRQSHINVVSPVATQVPPLWQGSGLQRSGVKCQWYTYDLYYGVNLGRKKASQNYSIISVSHVFPVHVSKQSHVYIVSLIALQVSPLWQVSILQGLVFKNQFIKVWHLLGCQLGNEKVLPKW